MPFFVRDAIWLGAVAAVICGLVWGSVKAGL
jgi:hypothetical protein